MKNQFYFILKILIFAIIITSDLHSEELSVQPSESKHSFNPDGYYFPSSPVIVSNDFQLKFLDIHTNDYSKGDALGTTINSKPKVRMSFIDNKSKKILSFNCKQWKIEKNKIDILCRSTPVGVINIHGHFLDQRGNFWDRDDIVPQVTVIMKADMTFTRGQNNVSQFPVAFTYWSGD